MSLGDDPQNRSTTMMNIDAIIRKFICFGDDPMNRSTTDDKH